MPTPMPRYLHFGTIMVCAKNGQGAAGEDESRAQPGVFQLDLMDRQFARSFGEGGLGREGEALRIRS